MSDQLAADELDALTREMLPEVRAAAGVVRKDRITGEFDDLCQDGFIWLIENAPDVARRMKADKSSAAHYVFSGSKEAMRAAVLTLREEFRLDRSDGDSLEEAAAVGEEYSGEFYLDAPAESWCWCSDPDDCDCDPDDGQDRAALKKALRELKSGQLGLLWDTEVRKVPHGEIASRYGVTKQAVSWQARKLKSKTVESA